jgi:hypothetical protein
MDNTANGAFLSFRYPAVRGSVAVLAEYAAAPPRRWLSVAEISFRPGTGRAPRTLGDEDLLEEAPRRVLPG